MNKPKYVKINDELYEINTDFRVALKCNEIAEDKTIGDTERALAILYTLFGEKIFSCEDKNTAIEKAMVYLSMGQNKNEPKSQNNNKYELDFNKCKGLIRSSFKFDYNYDPYEKEYLHWYDFYNDLCNLSTSEFGTCCALNRVTGILNTEEREIKDSKQREKLIKAKKQLAEMYCKESKKEATKEQINNAIELYKQLGIDIREEA